MRITLEYLLRHGVGRQNPCSLPEIVAHLNGEGVDISETGFQQTILKDTREGEVFIASSNRGYFLIADEQDAIVMRDFYAHRIEAESRNLRNLQRLARIQGWNSV
jgi:hypothetical protein